MGTAPTIGTGEQVLFWILGPLAVFGSLGLIFARKAVHAALGMALTMIILGVFYIAAGADFLGTIQILVYAAAVMMLFVFVIMLVGVDSSESLIETIKGQRWAALVLSLGLGGVLAAAVGGVTYRLSDGVATTSATAGNISGVADLIFGRYVWVFEATSALLITAALGAMVLAHREQGSARVPTSATGACAASSAGRTSPGCRCLVSYARHNAVDTPALLPDGSIAGLSVSRVLAARDQTCRRPAPPETEEAVRDEIESG